MNWSSINPPDPTLTYKDMSILNEDTLWLVNDDGAFGGVFRTTNGGANWDRQYQGNNPSKIYMYDRKFGFYFSRHQRGALYRTYKRWKHIGHR